MSNYYDKSNNQVMALSAIRFDRQVHCVSKKWHWCCRPYLQRTSTDFNSFWWQV